MNAKHTPDKRTHTVNQSSGNSRSFQLGYADTKYGIETFPAGGTDKFPTLADFRAGILKACELCQDSDYAAGSRAAFADLAP